MNSFLDKLEQIFSTPIFGELSLYFIIASILKYIFVFIIYYFIFQIIRLIYLDIRSINKREKVTNTYLRLITRPETLNFKVQPIYYLEDINTIGRDDKNTINLKNRYISKNHASITKEGDHFVLEDLNSANKTYLNDTIIKAPIVLKNRDIVRIGDVELLYINEVNQNES